MLLMVLKNVPVGLRTELLKPPTDDDNESESVELLSGDESCCL